MNFRWENTISIEFRISPIPLEVETLQPIKI